LSTAQASARGVRDIALFPSCTESIKPSLQFLRNFVVINTSERSLCFQIFFTTLGNVYISRFCTHQWDARPLTVTLANIPTFNSEYVYNLKLYLVKYFYKIDQR
jgi:hypothetical protein